MEKQWVLTHGIINNMGDEISRSFIKYKIGSTTFHIVDTSNVHLLEEATITTMDIKNSRGDMIDLASSANGFFNLRWEEVDVTLNAGSTPKQILVWVTNVIIETNTDEDNGEDDDDSSLTIKTLITVNEPSYPTVIKFIHECLEPFDTIEKFDGSLSIVSSTPVADSRYFGVVDNVSFFIVVKQEPVS